MKRTITIVLALILAITTFALAACDNSQGSDQTQEPPLTGDSNMLITYFSWSSTNNTKTMANYIADATGGELFRIVPQTPYTTNYNQVIDVAREERDTDARPALRDVITQQQLDQYDVIFIGYPIWWYDAPMIIYTFVESLDFSGKTIIPFATSGGSGLSGSDGKIADICEGATMLDGLVVSGDNIGNLRTRVEQWIQLLNLGEENQ